MKLSFFERLSGSAASAFDDEPTASIPVQGEAHARHAHPKKEHVARPTPLHDDQSTNEGQLPVDVHQTGSDIVIRAFVAGVRPDDLSLSISRDMVEIAGARAEREQVSGPDYFVRELFWGSFSRNILLPQEVDVDAASATAKDGLLTIILPKLDKSRQTKLRVKAG